jgi:hypothetical protein
MPALYHARFRARIVIRLRIELKVYRCRSSYSPRKRLAQRVEARLSKLETRASRIKLRDSIRAPSPLNVDLSHETGFVSVTQNLADFQGSSLPAGRQG